MLRIARRPGEEEVEGGSVSIVRVLRQVVSRWIIDRYILAPEFV